MAKTITFKGLKLDYEGIGKILKSPELEDVCVEHAQKRKGDGQRVSSFVGFDRVHAVVRKSRSN